MLNVAEETPTEQTSVCPQPIAPWIHTAFILLVLLLWAAYSALRFNLPYTAMPRSVVYVSSIVIQCLLAGSTVAGLYHRRQVIADMAGHLRQPGLKRDLWLGIATYVAALVLAGSVRLLTRLSALHLTSGRATVVALGPHTLSEFALWLLVSAAAGTCEEFVFRGYLQRQLAGWFGSISIAIAICSMIFGCLHFYQGTAGALQVTCLGILYGVVAARRGNLRSVTIAHFLQDAIAGLAIYLRIR